MPVKNYLLVSNNSASTNVSSDNSSFTTVLQNSFTIPMNAKNTRVYCKGASVVNFFYNISSAIGNNIIYWTDNVGLPQKYTITLPDGAYEVSDINNAIKNYFTALGLTTFPFVFLTNNALQKLIIQLEPTYGVRLPAKINELLGYTVNYTQFNSTSNPVFLEGSTTAKLNSVISLILSCSLVNTDYVNGEISNSMCTIPITARTGSLLAFLPNVPTIQYTNLQGQTINSIVLTIRDQLNRSVTIPEAWNAEITIEWD